MCFLREVLFYGTELIPLFPYLRAGLFKKGGGGGGGGGGMVVSDGSTPVNRMMISDHSLRVIDLKVAPGWEKE